MSAPVEQPRPGRGLHHSALAGPASVFRADGAQDPQRRRHAVQRLAGFFADPVQLAGAARAVRTRRLDHLLDPRQMLGQEPDVAPSLLARLAPWRGGRRRSVVVRRRRQRDVRFQIAKIQDGLPIENHARPLRPRAVYQGVHGLQRRLQPLDFDVALEHHADEDIWVSRQVFRPKRHAEDYLR
jgi:hypothetical protein